VKFQYVLAERQMTEVGYKSISVPLTSAMPLPDIVAALASFQQALDAREIDLHTSALDDKLFVHADRPNGVMRMTYVHLDGGKVTAMVQFAQAEPIDGEVCFNVGWAVPDDLRGKGRAAKAFIAAVKELRHGFGPHGMVAFWVEGIVDVDNQASRRVAEKVISPPVKTATDGSAGVPIVQYLRRIDAKTVL
jgi:hypothetical protein